MILDKHKSIKLFKTLSLIVSSWALGGICKGGWINPILFITSIKINDESCKYVTLNFDKLIKIFNKRKPLANLFSAGKVAVALTRLESSTANWSKKLCILCNSASKLNKPLWSILLAPPALLPNLKAIKAITVRRILIFERRMPKKSDLN